MHFVCRHLPAQCAALRSPFELGALRLDGFVPNETEELQSFVVG